MAAAEAIAADGVVFHLGSHLGRGLDAVLPQVTEAMAGVLAAADPGSATRLVIENSAGAGGTMGVGLDEIEQVVDALGRPDRVGVCLDTCHLWASGVDITDPGRVDDAHGRGRRALRPAPARLPARERRRRRARLATATATPRSARA